MQSLENTELKKLEKDLQFVLREFPRQKKNLHRRFAEAAKEEVDVSIGAVGFRDGGSRLKAMQKEYVGSRGGYAAIRARGTNDGGGSGRNSMGAITNYNENGHRIRPVRAGRKGRAKLLAVSGRHFYQNANQRVEQRTTEIAEEFAGELLGQLEG